MTFKFEVHEGSEELWDEDPVANEVELMWQLHTHRMPPGLYTVEMIQLKHKLKVEATHHNGEEYLVYMY